jgi:glucosamine--fructose-6-phosphate aminotransferase (isomerizing)
MIALWFSQQNKTHSEKRRKIMNDLRNIPYQIQCILEHADTIDKYLDFLNTPSIFLLGKGPNEAIAREGALKLKEIAYLHAEGCSSSSLKHGPFALIEPNLPIILFDIDDLYRDKTRNIYEEIKSRNAYILVVCDEYTDYYENILKIESNKTFGGLLANIYIQLISYHLALKNGYNPDYPRNLAKVVTVE